MCASHAGFDTPRCDTIVSLASGQGRSGVAVLRVSGPAVHSVAMQVLGAIPKPREAVLRNIRGADAQVLDQALVLLFTGPASFTGEDVLELHVHGSRAVIKAVLQRLLDVGCRLAEAGEFTRRAFLNGKLSLIEVEALADLIDSDTEQQRRHAMRALGGGLSRRIDAFRDVLLEARARLVAAIDFSDEDDVPASILHDIREAIATLAAEITALLRTAQNGERLRSGCSIVLLGPPNAGKSSLLNALSRRDVAIVSDVPGTTRDRVSVLLEIDGYPVTLTDTAGLRASEDAIEQLGQERSREAAREADVILWLSPYDAPTAVPAELDGRVVLVIRTKSDLADTSAAFIDGEVSVSVKRDEGLDTLLAVLGIQAAAALGLSEDVLVTRERHRMRLQEALDGANRLALISDDSPELIAEELALIERKLDVLVGRVDVEGLLDVVFSRFCIGK